MAWYSVNTVTVLATFNTRNANVVQNVEALDLLNKKKRLLTQRLKETNEMRRQYKMLLLISQAKVKASTIWLHLLVSHWRLQVYAREKRG